MERGERRKGGKGGTVPIRPRCSLHHSPSSPSPPWSIWRSHQAPLSLMYSSRSEAISALRSSSVLYQSCTPSRNSQASLRTPSSGSRPPWNILSLTSSTVTDSRPVRASKKVFHSFSVTVFLNCSSDSVLVLSSSSNSPTSVSSSSMTSLAVHILCVLSRSLCSAMPIAHLAR